MGKKRDAIVKAAIRVILCPDAGGYRHVDFEPSMSIEDTWEELERVVCDYVGEQVVSPAYPNHWSVLEMEEVVKQKVAKRKKRDSKLKSKRSKTASQSRTRKAK